MEGLDLFRGVIAPYFNFFLFLFLAYKLFKKPLLNMIQSRRTEYLELVEKSELARREAESAKTELDQKLKTLDQELAQMKANALASAEKEAQELIQHAKILAENIKNEAYKVAQAELRQARDDLKRDILNQATEMALKQVAQEVSEAQQAALIDHKIKVLPQIHLGGA